MRAFWAGFLGLRLVKQSAGFADGEQLHLFYGDAAGSPGSIVSFLVWEGGARGRSGHGQPFEIALAVPPASIGEWLSRALAAQLPVEGPAREFGEPVLRLKDPDGSAIIHLHGTGGNEADLMPIAHRLNPRAMLIGVRGRSTEEGINRWLRRFDAVTYDQADISAEAEAFAGFVAGAVRGYGLDGARMTFLGYSNGANLLGAVMPLHPGVVRRAVLLRGIGVLDKIPKPDLADTEVLMLSGAHDPFARMAPALEAALRAGGAALDARLLEAGHELTQADLDTARGWLAEQG